MDELIPVTAGEVRRRFAPWRERARTRDRCAMRVEELPSELVEAIAASEPSEEARRFDGEVD